MTPRCRGNAAAIPGRDNSHTWHYYERVRRIDIVDMINNTALWSNGSTGVPPDDGHQWPLLLLLSLILASSCLSLTVIFIVYHRVALHHQCYYIVASLAVSDLLRSALVMPLALAQLLLGMCESLYLQLL